MNIKSQIKSIVKSLKKIGSNSLIKTILSPVVGFLALIWFLIRVLPKPSRINYPCVRAAAPLASGFIIYIGGIIASLGGYKLFKLNWKRSQYIISIGCLIMAVGGIVVLINNSSAPVYSEIFTEVHPANEPMGEAQGIYPGRVVWVHNPEATNEKAAWQDLPRKYNKDAWFLDKNNNQEVIDQMFSEGIQTLTGESDDAEAWKSIFKYFNSQKGKGDISYQEGEKIFVKINVTSGGNGWHMINFDYKKDSEYGMTETSPHVVLTLLRHLVHVVGVPQNMITVGDPINQIYQDRINKWYNEFPDVTYLDEDISDKWRTLAVEGDAIIDYSDRGKILRTGDWNNAQTGDPVNMDHLFKSFEEADYLINLPALKGHKHAGVTMFAKNHFGSQTRETAMHLHGGLIATDNVNYNPWRDEYGMYRVQVDLMGHELLGGNTLFFILDALWATDFENDQPDRFKMAPFNNDWTSSILFSQDMVAIESVGFDIMRSEFSPERYPDAEWGDNTHITTYPNMPAVDDYLHQAADSSNWPEDIEYDPENDGSILESLGVHEHWNNDIDRQYSRNLETGDGIELVYLPKNTSAVSIQKSENAEDFSLDGNYPNPFNSSTTIRFSLDKPLKVTLEIYNIRGQKVRTIMTSPLAAGQYEYRWNGLSENGQSMPSGVYVARLAGHTNNRTYQAMYRLSLIN